MWAGSVLATVSSVVAQSIDGHAGINKKVTAAISQWFTDSWYGWVSDKHISVWYPDQLPDASTNAINFFYI